MADDTAVSCKIVGRTGPFLSLAVIKKAEEQVAFVRAALICDTRSVPGSWLFAAPLASTSSQRLLEGKLSVVDLVFFGHQSDGSETYSLHSTLSDLVGMIPPRLKDISEKDASASQAMAKACQALFKSVEDLHSNDSSAMERSLIPLDDTLSIHVEVRFVDESGEVHDLNLPLTAISFAQWIANYVGPEFTADLEGLQKALAGN